MRDDFACRRAGTSASSLVARRLEWRVAGQRLANCEAGGAVSAAADAELPAGMTHASIQCMDLPIQITFRSIAHSDAVEFAIRQRAARLDRFCDQIQRCHVTVDMPHGHRHQGNHYAIHIDIITRAGEVCVTRSPSLDDSHEDFHAVVRDAFDAATRQLQADVQRLRGDVKDHAHASPLGRVARLFPRDGYGFVVANDGREIYFHENSVVDARFDRLSVGSEVRFTIAPDDSDQGARAGSVHLVTG